MERFAVHWKALEDVDSKDQTWKRVIRTGVLIGLLGDCMVYGILDSTRSKYSEEDNMGCKPTMISV